MINRRFKYVNFIKCHLILAVLTFRTQQWRSVPGRFLDFLNIIIIILTLPPPAFLVNSQGQVDLLGIIVIANCAVTIRFPIPAAKPTVLEFAIPTNNGPANNG